MWMSRQAYQDVQTELVKARAEVAAQAQANILLEATMNWFRHRITQIEMERANLIHHALGIKIPVPEFQKPDNADQRSLHDHQFDEHDIFRGLSDADATKQGLDWDDDGRLVETH